MFPSRKERGTAAEYRDLFAGILVLVGCLFVALGATVWSEQTGRPPVQGLWLRPDQIPGWPAEVDPLALIPRLQESRGVGGLRELHLTGVTSSGILDMAYGPTRGRLVFEEKSDSGERCRARTATLSRKGVVFRPGTGEWGSCGPVLPKLGCGPRRLFSMAKSRGADPKLRANVRTERHESGPLWKLTMPGTGFSLLTDLECRREVSPAELRHPKG